MRLCIFQSFVNSTKNKSVIKIVVSVKTAILKIDGFSLTPSKNKTNKTVRKIHIKSDKFLVIF
jgi:hypothetical protein